MVNSVNGVLAVLVVSVMVVITTATNACDLEKEWKLLLITTKRNYMGKENL